MGQRLCVIGNSHVAALKLAFDEAASVGQSVTGGFRPTFFGAPSDGMRHVRLEDGIVHPQRPKIGDYFRKLSGGMDQIRLADYDAFLLVGLNVSIKRILRFYKTHAWVGLSGTEGKMLVHPEFARKFLAERFADTRLVELSAMIRSAVDRPILAVAEPYWAATVRSSRSGPDYGWNAAIQFGDARMIGQAFQRAVTEALAPFARLVPQPEATVDEGILTRIEFNNGASSLISGEGEESDASHMNAAYGAAVWSDVVASLAK